MYVVCTHDFIRQRNPYQADKIYSLSNQNLECTNFIQWIGIFPLDKVIHSLYNQAIREYYLHAESFFEFKLE